LLHEHPTCLPPLRSTELFPSLKTMHPLLRSKVRRSVKLGPRNHQRNALPHYVPCLIRQHRSHLSNKLRLHIPQINFHFQPRGFNFIVHRMQAPLALCYAPSFNGCQGLTVRKLGVDLRRSVFSHGQLYSAMTRVPDTKNVFFEVRRGPL
jgi:hypothetical protein